MMHADVKPEHLMEKVLFATDELTGLIGAAGCSREVIEQGAEMLGWPLDEVLQKTLDAMKDCEAKQ